jgi:hypothetical protein
MIRCPHAKALWQIMRSCWDLPDVEMLFNSGPEWIFDVLLEVNEIQRLMLLMLLLRIWHNRNQFIHDKPVAPMESSKRFLCSYVDSILCLQQQPQADPSNTINV